jgi:hypothetical protein
MDPEFVDDLFRSLLSEFRRHIRRLAELSLSGDS